MRYDINPTFSPAGHFARQSLISHRQVYRKFRKGFISLQNIVLRYFALCSVMYYLIIILVYQILNKYKLIPFVFQAFEDVGECDRGVVGIVVEKHNRTVLHPWGYTLTNTLRRCIIFPVKWIPTGNSWKRPFEHDFTYKIQYELLNINKMNCY